jgi:8-oxo-dGTP pyrophosphatase MutT (NUDIX family)
VLRDLRFLGQWALSAPLPVAPDQTSVEGDEALILRGVAPRRDVVPAGACGAPGQGVVAAPVGGGPVLALHPFCLFDSAPVLGRLPEPSDAGACRWPSVQLLTRATDTPLYRCSASGELVSRSELADSVAAALAPAVAPGRALSTRWGLLWIGIRQTRKLNDACGHDVVDRILIAMDRAASAWDATHGDVWGKGPFAFPFWRHGDELAIPFLSDNSCDPFPAVCSAAAHVVAAATHEAMQCGLGMHWPTSEAARESHAPSPGPLRVFVGFTLDAGVVQGSCQPLAHRMMAELAEIRDAERACGEACENGPPLLWIGRSNTRAPWRMQATPVFARVSEASFAILRNAASPGDWLLRRNRHRGIGNLVGGHLEDMDANDGCALVRREIREELGLSVRARELAPLGDAPATAIEFSDRAKCMTYYILRFFQASLPPDRFGETACSAHHCHWEPAQRIVSQSAPSAVARFPARLLTAAATGSPGLRTAASLDDWRPLSDVMDEHSRSLPAQQPPAPVAGNQPEPPPPPPKR